MLLCMYLVPQISTPLPSQRISYDHPFIFVTVISSMLFDAANAMLECSIKDIPLDVVTSLPLHVRLPPFDFQFPLATYRCTLDLILHRL